MTVDATTTTSLSDLFGDDPVSAALAALIRTLEPGDKLPSERDLAVQLQVSRTALRDRLGVLEGLGVLKRRKGSGTFVEQLQPSALATALNLAMGSSHLPLESLESVRIALERQAAREAVKQSDPVLIAYMRRAIDTMKATDDHREVIIADRAFHQSLLRAAGNAALTFFADALTNLLQQDLEDRSARLQHARLSEERQQLVIHHHERIYEAILSGDADLAMAAVDAHFDALPAS